MRRVYEFSARIAENLLKLDYPADFKRLLTQLNGKRVVVSIDLVRRRRTTTANAYYWGVVIPLLAEHCGYENEELHEALKFRLLRDRENERENLPRVKSSASLDTKEFAEYVDGCIRIAAEMGVIIPLPEERQ